MEDLAIRYRALQVALVLVAVAICYIGTALANSVTANGAAEVIIPISISIESELSFGTFNPGSVVGTVTVSRITNERTATGGVELVASDDVSRGKVAVTGSPGASFSMTIPADDTVVLSNGTGGTMTIQTFDVPIGNYVLSGTGLRFRHLGATLGIAANQPTGTYTGTYEVSVVYD